MSNAYEAAKAAVMERVRELTECEHCQPYVDELVRYELLGARGFHGETDTEEGP